MSEMPPDRKRDAGRRRPAKRASQDHPVRNSASQQKGAGVFAGGLGAESSDEDLDGIEQSAGDAVEQAEEPARSVDATPEPDEDTAGTHALLPGFAADTAGGPDLRGIAVETRALGSVLIARDVAPPLAVGLFGDWGVGKSFFMEKLRAFITRCVRTTREAEGSPFCRSVLQVSFNAWHYVDANLWASLVTHIFDAFVTGDPADTVEQRDERRKLLLEELELARAEKEQVEALRLAAEEKAIAAHDHFEACTAERKAALEELTKAVAEDPMDSVVLPELEPAVKEAVRALLGRAAGQPGEGDEEDTPSTPSTIDELEQVLIEARTSAGLLRRLGVIDARGDIRWSWTLTLVLLIALAAGLAVGVWKVWGSVAGAVAGALSLVGLVTRAVLPRLRTFRRALAKVEGYWQRRVAHRFDVVRAEHRARIAAAERRLVRADAALDEATAAEDAATTRQAELEAELRGLDPVSQLRSFVEERVQSADYRGQLGIIAKVRTDFERLSELLAQVRAGEGAELRELFGSGEPVERIVLYIDDLDRCPSDRVIEVLQAVHLLLAFPLFAVVVAVDPRWLLRAISAYYPELLDAPATGSDAASAHDYLEKIFQIPFAIEPMTERAAQSFVGRLLVEHEQAAGAAGADSADGANDASDAGDADDGGGADKSEGDGDGDDGTFSVQARALVLEPHERAFLADMAFLVRSPRRAKRLVNTYRLLRVAVPPDELDAFVGSEHEPGAFRAAVILLCTFIGHPEVAPHVASALSRSPTDQPWTAFLDALAASARGVAAEAAAATAAATRADEQGPDASQAFEFTGREVEWRACIGDLRRLGEFTASRLPESLAPYAAWLSAVRRYSFVA